MPCPEVCLEKRDQCVQFSEGVNDTVRQESGEDPFFYSLEHTATSLYNMKVEWAQVCVEGVIIMIS